MPPKKRTRGLKWSDWTVLTTKDELSLVSTLYSGQSFMWRREIGSHVSSLLVGDVNRVIQLREDADIQWRQILEDCEDVDTAQRLTAEALISYFQLDIKLGPMIAQWSAADPRMKAKAEAIPGLRVMRQDPVSCLFSFICSQNNNVKRIEQMVSTLCESFGSLLTDADPALDLARPVYAFPTLDQLAKASEEDLRKLGFGYRARFIVTAVRQVLERGGRTWLMGLRHSHTSVAGIVDCLMDLTGVGMKVAGTRISVAVRLPLYRFRHNILISVDLGRSVIDHISADCVALYSLDRTACVPVDTHIWQVASQDYDKSLAKSKISSLTPELHDRVQKVFENLFGEQSGWAQAVLFCAELPRFKIGKAGDRGEGSGSTPSKKQKTQEKQEK